MSIQLLGLDEATAALRKLGRERMNIAIAAGLNRTLVQVERAEKIGMSRSLDRPTPFTLNSMRLAKADRNKLTGRLFVMDKQAKYLGVTVRGGRIDTLTPAAASTNMHGNLAGKRRGLVAIAQRLGRGRRGRNGLPIDMFIGEIKGTFGLWQRFDRYRTRGNRWTARPPRLLVKVDKDTLRTPRWDFYGIAERTARARLATDIRDAIASEIKAL